MAVHHHPSEAILISYAAASLGESLSVVVATHLTFCSSCRTIVAHCEAMGGSMLEALPPEPMSQNAKEQILACLDAPSCRSTHPERVGADDVLHDQATPRPLALYLGGSLSSVRWQVLAPGFRQSEVVPRDCRGGVARLLRIEPGRSVPRHGHQGTELSLVLSGELTDEPGHFSPGDVCEVDRETVHGPSVKGHEACICLVAREAPPQFKPLLARLAHRFILI